jgi:DNA adenine methylase
MMRPLVKCLGGKTRLLPALLPHAHWYFDGYCEPFVGGGALFWKLCEYKRFKTKPAVIADVNPGLISLYQAVRDDVGALIAEVEGLARLYTVRGDDAHRERMYYGIRDQWNGGYRPPAHYLFLKQLAFNGLWRENKAGGMNAPWGKYETFSHISAEELRDCSQGLQGVTIVQRDFRQVLQLVGHVDGEWLVYVDPPYWGTFSGYSAEGFDAHDHIALLEACQSLTAKGHRVVYSNADLPEVRAAITKYWPSADFTPLSSVQSVAAQTKARGKRAELIAHTRRTNRGSDTITVGPGGSSHAAAEGADHLREKEKDGRGAAVEVVQAGADRVDHALPVQVHPGAPLPLSAIGATSDELIEERDRWMSQLKDPKKQARVLELWELPENKRWLAWIRKVRQMALEGMRAEIQAMRERAMAAVEARQDHELQTHYL